MKIFISADMEGITGITHDEQTEGSSNQYIHGCKLMTGDVNAAIEGCLEAGADEIYVKDAHGNGRNIIIEELNKHAILIPGWDIMMNMVQGIDESFDALILIGYHSMIHTENGILAHTMTSSIRGLSINNHPIGEAELSSLIAGYYGVPVVFISGDHAVVNELRRFVGEIPYVITKYGMGRETGRLLHPSLTHTSIKEKVSEAVRKREQFKPLQMEPPLNVSVKLSSAKATDLVSLVPGIQKTNTDEISCSLNTPIELLKMLRIIMGLAWSIR